MTKKKPAIEWRVEKRKVIDLIPWEKNPRYISEFMFKKLEESILKGGVFELPIVNTDGTIIGGHQRKEAFLRLGIDEVDCLVPHRHLSDREFVFINIASNKIEGDWDNDLLANEFDEDLLLEAGFTEREVGKIDMVEPSPDDLTEEDKPKPAKMVITFKSPEDLQHAENRIAVIVDSYEGAHYSVSTGEV